MTAGAPTERFARILWHICVHGLHQTPQQLSPKDLAVQAGILRDILSDQEGVSTTVLCQAIEYGMPHIFPISENGYFDARDVARYLVKAKAAAAAMRQQGKMPISPRASEARLDRMAAEDGWDE